MHRSPADPNAAAARWSAAKSTSASGRMIAWFLAPPSAWTRLPLAVPRSWMYLAIGVEPTNDTAATSGESRIVSTATLSPWTTLKTPSGRPGLLPQLGEPHRRRGVALAGLEHEGVAAGDRDREHPHRDHRREVERGDPRDHAERLAERVGVHTGGHLVGEVALEQGRDPAGELDHLEAALHLAERVGQHLAVLVGDQLGDLLGVPVDQLAEGEQDLGPLATATSATTPRRRPWRPRWRPRRRPCEPSSTSACCAPVAGLKTAAVRSLLPEVALPAIQC